MKKSALARIKDSLAKYLRIAEAREALRRGKGVKLEDVQE